ncbi:hypothetical protein JOC86_003131 [Bacillus pakistanensis]|uniref:Uncharacterized protein n=1 Tax=Rossellomorea pakistanensis TaxID=992288 RepID=A0ABS2NFN5_9BACI|nr:hypothetical protein [Bacillus pakistanensis]MBM7586579.1 hypothetical protein [Bacillus pakistanensis]
MESPISCTFCGSYHVSEQEMVYSYGYRSGMDTGEKLENLNSVHTNLYLYQCNECHFVMMFSKEQQLLKKAKTESKKNRLIRWKIR